MLFTRLTCPFVQGCATMAQSMWIWYSSQNQRNFVPVNCVPLSVIMEFGTPKQWMMSRKNSMACLDLIEEIGRASIHFVNLSTGDKQVRIALGRPLERSNKIDPLDHEWPRDGDHLECLGR